MSSTTTNLSFGMALVALKHGKRMQPGWLASQADMLSEDWEIVE